MTNPRIVVTGERDGKSVVFSDGEGAVFDIPLMPGSAYAPVWGSDVTPALPTTGESPDARTYFPPPGGFRFCFFTLGPASATLPEDFDAAAATSQVRREIPGLLDVMEPDNPGMHTSDTVDVDFVLSGEVHVELDDGAEVHLKAGDVLVQNGTRHAWRNRSDEPCVLVVAVVGARRE
ncbi:cupin domain-containing protein [Actinophytocola sp.]|uniref:cupin domain-containing protein n=1 Tax=Actinophytocola sp. TaxID=1872138 RepID=UPI003D6A2DC7